MEMKRQPLKRLCSDFTNESPRKRRYTAAEDGAENRVPGAQEEPSNGTWPSLLRCTEREVKPDTPAIASVRSRIQRFQERRRRADGAHDMKVDSLPWTESEVVVSGLMDAVSEEEVEQLAGCRDEGTVEKAGGKWGLEEHLPMAHSTLATQRPLHSDEEPASTETASRLRKERQEELAMVCAVLDRSNPWRAASMRQPQKRALMPTTQDLSGGRRRRRVRTGRGRVKMGPILDSDSSGSESVEYSLEGSDGSLDISDDRCVSSLEVRLRRSCDSDCLAPEEPPSSLCDAADGSSPEAVIPDGDERRITLNSSELIDRIFEGVLDVSEAAEEPDVDLPPVSILSPLTKSLDIQAAISPLSSVVSSLPELHEEPPETPKTSIIEETHLPYSIDTYRTLQRNVLEEPTSQRRLAIKNHLPKRQTEERVPMDAKEKIKLLSKEVTSLQRIIEQSCCALSYCVDAEHGKGTRQEAEAERLLLLSCEKKAALLTELERLRGGRSEEPLSSPGGELRPCRGSVTLSEIRLPLKVDYVCSTILETGPAGHYFVILIRYGAYDVVATPLASASDAQTGDTIIFPTTVTLKDASADFRIEIEVYSLAQVGTALILDKRKSLKPKITPKKLLSSRKSSLNSPAYSPAVNTPLRSSNFLLVGSLNLTLDSLGRLKFPLEKMKLEGKVGRLLGNHFQDKVPFLSPLEGNLYLKVQCQSHSSVQRSGFLTMFEDVSGLGAWHRRWCVLSGNTLSFWAYPDQENCKEPLGRTNLINCTSAKVEAAMRESCARPNTLELVTMRPQREDDVDSLVTQCRNMLCFTKSWLSADTREDRQLWMDSLNQVLLDLRTWKTSPGKVPSRRQALPAVATAH
ncbi:anillin-like isoform X1 [Bufo gargarizans]|uniref:anillin-like isoform X1 n=1 Tax=Bufo gargarizans TaxID=30331 RepID=UPI001CF44A75|nr:anillin-like isoform X1 [Bufo gargarizans]